MKQILITLLAFLNLLHARPAELEQDKLLRQRVYAVDAELAKGDFSSVDEAAKNRDLAFLWGVYGGSPQIGWSYYEALGRTQEEHRAFQRQLRAYVGERLAAIPGHAKWQGDRIDSASTDPERENVRKSSFTQLGLLATPECIHELGRFLFDQRRHEVPGLYDNVEDRILPGFNYMDAIQNMDIALGENSPWKPFRVGGWVNPTPELKGLMQDWWLSEASLPYRQGSPYPLPPPGTWKLKQGPPKAMPAPPPAPAVEPSRSMWEAWLVCALLLVGTALSTWLAVQRRRGRE